MNDRQLRSFLLAVETKSFSKAAARAFISTQSFIQQINLLEENLGFPLFTRTRRGIELTVAGETFYPTASKILQLYDASCILCRQLDQIDVAPLRIAYAAEQFPAFFLEAYQDYFREGPSAHVQFVPLPFSCHINQIASGNIDLSVIAEPKEDNLNGIRFLPLCEDTCSFCMRPDHVLSERKKITVEDLANIKILCGSFPYMKLSFSSMLSHCNARLDCIESEYDMDVRIRSLLSDEIFVIHSLWARPYETFMRVVPSNLPAGRIGVVCTHTPGNAVCRFIKCLQKQFDTLDPI